MAKTAIKTTKKVSKVSTAKGKGKAPKAKVVKKVTLAKTKGDLKKPVKKAPKTVDPNKYGKFIIEDCPNDKYPEMVIITVAPKMYDDFIGRKYVSRDRCITTIESVRTGDSIDKGAKSVLKEMDAAGIVPMEPAETDDK